MNDSFTPSATRSTQLAVASTFAVTLFCALWLFWPGLDGPFVFDDFVNLSRLNSLGGELSAESLGAYVTQFPGTPGRPLAALSFLINDVAWPSDPHGFKYTNLLLHLLAGVLLFGLSRALARAAALSAKADAIAVLTLAIWLLHPIQLSTLMLVVQRMTVLAALFSFAGLWAYVSVLQRADRPRDAIFAIAALGTGTVLSVLCKESGALTPLLACVLNATLLRRQISNLPEITRRIFVWGAQLPVVALVAALLFQWRDLTSYDGRDFDLVERLLTQPRVLLDYLRLIALPRMGGSGLYHDDLTISRDLFQPATTLPALLVVVSMLGAGWAARSRAPLLAFALLWFFAGHALESSVFPLELYFEHRNYLPMFGPAFAAAAGVLTLRNYRFALLTAGALWLALSMFMSRAQAIVWGNEALIATIWAHDNPSSPRAQQQLASYLERSGKPEQAIAIFTSASQRGISAPDFPFQTLLVACKHNVPFSEPLRTSIEEASTNGGYNHTILGVMSILREQTEANVCPDIMDSDYWWLLSENLLANNRFTGAGGTSYIRIERAYFLTRQRDLDGTMREFEAAFAESPSIELSQLIATTLLSAGLSQEAREWLQKGLSIRQPLIKKLFSPSAEQSRRLIAFIESHYQQSATPPIKRD